VESVVGRKKVVVSVKGRGKMRKGEKGKCGVDFFYVKTGVVILEARTEKRPI